MKFLIDFIKEGLKVNSKSKIKEYSNVKDIKSFADKYNCKFIFKYLLEASDVCSSAFDYILKLPSQKWNDFYDDVSKLVYKLNQDKSTKFNVTRTLHSSEFFINCFISHTTIEKIKISYNNIVKNYVIEEYIDKLTSDQLEILYKILDYTIQYYEDTKK